MPDLCPHCAEPLPHPTPCAAQLGVQLADAHVDRKQVEHEIDTLRVEVARLREEVAHLERELP